MQTYKYKFEIYLFCLRRGKRESNKQKDYRGKNLARCEETETEALSQEKSGQIWMHSKWVDAIVFITRPFWPSKHLKMWQGLSKQTDNSPALI